MTNNEINAISDELKSEIEAIFLNPPPVAYTPIEFGPGWAEAIWGGPTYPTYHIQWGPSLPIDSWTIHPAGSNQSYMIEFPSGWSTIYYRVKGKTEAGDDSEWSNTVELTLL